MVEHEWHDQQANELIPEVWETIGKKPMTILAELPTMLVSCEGENDAGKMTYKTIYCFNNREC
jgi:hypothetical protein